jgi:positive regulator of sigma E activity
MIETGIIREINGKTVIIKPDAQDACFGCLKEECKACGSITAENPLSLSLASGQKVEVSAPVASIFRQALAALVPPAAGFTAGFFIIRVFFKEAGEGAAAGVGALFLFASSYVIFKLRAKIPAGKVFTVTRIIDP